MTRVKLLTATARLSVIIATSALAQVIQGHCAYAFHCVTGATPTDYLALNESALDTLLRR
jgi:hypothetical protein